MKRIRSVKSRLSDLERAGGGQKMADVAAAMDRRGNVLVVSTSFALSFSGSVKYLSHFRFREARLWFCSV